MKSNQFITIYHHVLLTIITLLLLFVPLGTGMFFGSEGDWYSQHVGIAESLRQTMLETHSLIPQYIHLGGGSSIYDFAYYGLLRPDIVFSCLVPDIEMKYIIAGYAALGVLVSVNLCHLWLKKQGISKKFAFTGAILLAASTCFYHAHHQIMFVNYIPFLFLALMGVDSLIRKKKSFQLVLSLFLIYLHSFYYSIACLFVIGIYTIYKVLEQEETRIILKEKKWKQIGKAFSRPLGKLILIIFISIGMAMVLLLPTGLDILSNEKDAGSFVTVSAKIVDWSLKGLLYSPYGCGMTLLTLYCLLLSVTRKGKKFLSGVLLICVLFPGVSLILNGFLYSRTKILIPFVALLILVVSDTLEKLYRGKQRFYYIPFLCCLIPVLCSSWKPVILLDGTILFIWMQLWRTGKIPESIKVYAYWMIMFVPVFASLCVNMSDSCLKPVCSKLKIGTNGAYLKAEDDRQSHFTLDEITDFVTDDGYRFDVLANNFVNCNLLADGNIHKTAMYSSVTNTDYARFYYDTMRNPISLNNRVALVPNQNYCFSYFMGLKYILTDENTIPYGYEKEIQKGHYILAKNDNVLPVCYGTTELLSSGDYEELKFPDTLEALCTRAVVSDNTAKNFTSHFEEENEKDFFADNGVKKLLHPSGKKEKYTLPLAKSLSGKMLIMSFHVERSDGNEVIISINGMKNKLSGREAPYPNHNYEFTYVLSAEKSLDELEIELSKGKYTIDNLKIYTIDYEKLVHLRVVKPVIKEKNPDKNCNVFKGEIIMEDKGYFITSYPYREGYQVQVDGLCVNPEKVNTAFLGFPVGEGKHQIEISFKAPGFEIGYVVSIVSCFVFGILVVLENVNIEFSHINSCRFRNTGDV